MTTVFPPVKIACAKHAAVDCELGCFTPSDPMHGDPVDQRIADLEAALALSREANALEQGMRRKAEAERDAFRETLTMKGVVVQTETPTAAMRELERLANDARDVSNRNAEIANANRSLREKAQARAEKAEAALRKCVEAMEPGRSALRSAYAAFVRRGAGSPLVEKAVKQLSEALKGAREVLDG